VAENRSAEIAALSQRAMRMGEYLHLDAKRVELAALDARSAEPGFWDDQSAAQATMAAAAGLRDEIESFERVIAGVEDAEVANELAVADDDSELESEVVSAIAELTARIDELEVASWFTGEFDAGEAIVTITPGQGGLEAQDWAEMLLRMYTKYAERKRWKLDLHDAPAGVELGIDRAVFTVHGRKPTACFPRK
jgi:peptide chain release factor 2